MKLTDSSGNYIESNYGFELFIIFVIESLLF
jgi:hypothetical protein